jgi:hypothetical protein
VLLVLLCTVLLVLLCTVLLVLLCSAAGSAVHSAAGTAVHSAAGTAVHSAAGTAVHSAAGTAVHSAGALHEPQPRPYEEVPDCPLSLGCDVETALRHVAAPRCCAACSQIRLIAEMPAGGEPSNGSLNGSLNGG